MGLLGASVTLAIQRALPSIKSIGYSHRPSTRKKARQLGVAGEIIDVMGDSVADADIVILATPICTFEAIFDDIAGFLKPGCIVTDVGSTKSLPHKWADKTIKNGAHYVGSHPIAGSEKRGIEYARDDLFFGAKCILTKKANTDEASLKVLDKFWTALGCKVEVMTPAEHDRIFGRVSHLPHVTAAALINASNPEQLSFAGKGFVDTSRIASGPANIWADIFLTNQANISMGIRSVVRELTKLEKAITSGNRKQIEKLLSQARDRRSEMIDSKMKRKELL